VHLMSAVIRAALASADERDRRHGNIADSWKKNDHRLVEVKIGKQANHSVQSKKAAFVAFKSA
jgi:hypothetical protein